MRGAPRRFGVVSTLLAGIVLVACTSTPIPAGGLSAASSGVCEAISALPETSVAERAFTNRAHEALHALAGDPRLERSLAAGVLEAKQRVESDIAEEADAGVLGDDLAALLVAADAALTALGEDVPPCE